MGILLELLGLLVTGAFACAALKPAGIDIGWLNPLTLARRIGWGRRLSIPALYCLEDPIDVAAAMGTAMLLYGGMVREEQKNKLVALFERHFSADTAEAEKLWIASSYLLKGRPIEPCELSEVFTRSAHRFSSFHVAALLSLMREAATLEPAGAKQQQALIDGVRQIFARRTLDPRSWGSAP